MYACVTYGGLLGSHTSASQPLYPHTMPVPSLWPWKLEGEDRPDILHKHKWHKTAQY